MKLRCVSPRLSQKKKKVGKASSWKRAHNQTILDAALAIAQYSVFVNEQATTRSFKLYEIGLQPRNVMFVDLEVQSSILPA